jgi:hypothetical protein
MCAASAYKGAPVEIVAAALPIAFGKLSRQVSVRLVGPHRRSTEFIYQEADICSADRAPLPRPLEPALPREKAIIGIALIEGRR